MDPLPYDPAACPRKPQIPADDFFAVDMRAGRIVSVEGFPEARKPSYKVLVDFGPVIGTLPTSAQITFYDRAELEGRMVVGALNLGTKRIAGFESRFLILGTYDPDGRVRLLQVEDGVAPGSVVG